ncbi:MAG: F0F1 ATP synthase subunit A, partial [Planctomycetota bacterium]
MIRALVCLALIAAPIYLSNKYSAHHDPSGNIFHDLYSHVLPAPLVTGHGDHGDHGDEGHAADDHAEGHGDSHGDDSHGSDSHGADSHGGHAIPESEMIAVALPLPSLFKHTDHQEVKKGVPVFNLQIFQIFSVLLLLVAFSGVASAIRTGKGDYLSRLFAGFAGWVRDEMVTPVMGKGEGDKYLPFFLTLFFFILFMNFLGLIPGGATATANIGVTGALAAITFLSMIGLGMMAQGPGKFWMNLVPHGLPVFLWPLMFVI